MTQFCTLACSMLAWLKVQFSIQAHTSPGSADRTQARRTLRTQPRWDGGGFHWTRKGPGARGPPVDGELASIIRHILITELLKNMLLRMIKYSVWKKWYL